MWNAGLDEAQAGIKIARRNINNLRNTDDTTLTAESEKELKSLLMRVKESEKPGLKINFQKLRYLKREETHVHLWLINADVWQKSNHIIKQLSFN